MSNESLYGSDPAPATDAGVVSNAEAEEAFPDPTSDYYANKDAEELGKEVVSLVSDTSEGRRANGINARARKNWNLYYARPEGYQSWSENLLEDGEDAESVRVSVNVTRNLVKHILSMVNSVEPVAIPKAENTDSGSIRRAEIAKALAEHLLKQLHGFVYLNRATEHAAVLAQGFVHLYWNRYAGGKGKAFKVGGDDGAEPSDIASLPSTHAVEVRQDEDTGDTFAALYRGEVAFENPLLTDVFYDPQAQSWEELEDVVVRTWRNKYDLLAEYGAGNEEMVARINAQPTRRLVYEKNRVDNLPLPLLNTSKWDHKIAVWYYYHRKTRAVPTGRMLMCLDDGTPLEDGPLYFDNFPLVRIAPDEMIGVTSGYCPVTSLGGMQEGFDSVASAMLTNLFAFAKQTLIAQAGSRIDVADLSGGMKLIETDFLPNGQAPVKPLELLSIKEETFKALELLQAWMEQDAGVSAIVRGDPQGVTAGVAINLYQAMAQQFAGPMEKSRAAGIEDLVQRGLEAYRAHPDVPRMLRIVGKGKRESLTEFMIGNLDGIQGWQIDLGNPMMRTVAGRVQMLQSLTATGAPITLSQAMQVLSSGNLDVATDGITDEQLLIEQETELLLENQPVPVRMGDDHMLHLIHHRRAGNSPDLRLKDAQLRASFQQQVAQAQMNGQPPPMAPVFPLDALNQHEMEHMHYWTQGDPVLNMAQGRLPPGPPMPPPGPPGSPPPGARPNGPPPGNGAHPNHPPGPPGPGNHPPPGAGKPPPRMPPPPIPREEPGVVTAVKPPPLPLVGGAPAGGM